MRSRKPTRSYQSRAGERGAALITAVLLSLLLLAAGGTLILTATMTSITARDSTAEMQAYYAAEAGLARTLEVLRGNLESDPVGTKATFKNVVCNRELWDTINGDLIDVTVDQSAKFRVMSIIDPDNQDKDAMCNPADPTFVYRPSRLRIQVLGMGPGNSQKNMEMIVNRYTLDYPVNAVINAPNGSGNPIAFALGDSNPTTISGVDASAGSGSSLSAIAISNSDYQTVNNVIDGCDADGSNCGNGPDVTPGDPMVLVEDNTPSFLQSVTNARVFMYGSEGMMQSAINQGRYFTSGADAIASAGGLGATNSDGLLTFVDGDLTLGPGDPTGQGPLVVTGTLTLNGNFNWNGVIMVLGAGRIYRSGAGHGNIYGAIYIANFAKTGASTDVFGAPTFDTSGGGTSNIQYSSAAVDMAKAVGGHAIKGVREF